MQHTEFDSDDGISLSMDVGRALQTEWVGGLLLLVLLSSSVVMYTTQFLDVS